MVAATVLVVYLVVWTRKYGLDLQVYRDSAATFVNGRNPYHSTFTKSHLAFTYPPFALIVLSVLTWGSFAVAQSLMWAVSIAVTTAAVAIVLVDRGYHRSALLWCGSLTWTCVAMLVVEPARSGLDYGQIEFVLMFLVVADTLLVPAPFRGFLLGVASAIKLTPLIFILIFFVRRDRMSAARAVLSFVACTGLAWLFWADLSRTYWLHDVAQTERVGGAAYGGNQSWYAILHRPPFPATGSAIAWAALSVGTLLVGTFVAWRCVDTDRQSFAVIAIALVGLLVSPISWSHHWVWVILLPPMLVGSRRHETGSSIRIMLWGIVILTIAAPYWWISLGWAGVALQAALPIWTFATLTVWCGTEYVRWTRSKDDLGRSLVGPAPVT